MSLRPTGHWFAAPPEGDVVGSLLDWIAAGGRSVVCQAGLAWAAITRQPRSGV